MASDTLVIEGIHSQGYGIVGKAVMRDREVTAAAKGLYAYICSYAGSGTIAWPGRDLICHDLNLNKDTYTKHLSALRKKDYIRVEKKTDAKGRFVGNNFIVVYHPCPKISDTDKGPCPNLPDTVFSDTNSNRSLIDHNDDIAKKLSTRKNELNAFREEIRCTTSQRKKLLRS